MKTRVFIVLLIGMLSIAARGEGTDGAAKAEATVIRLAREYETAFNMGDTAALAAMFTEDVEYIDEDGALLSGRDPIEALLKKSLALNPGANLAIQIESVRALTPDVIVERGKTLTTSRDGEQMSSVYTAINVRQNGKWRIQQLVESPAPMPSPGEMLSDLAWMVGTWKEQDGDAEIETQVGWSRSGNFLTRNFKVTVHDIVTLQGWQIIGWDAAEKTIRSWLFDSEGAFQEGIWTRTGNGWTIRQSGYIPDGGTLSSESSLQRVGEDKCIWELTNRTLDGDPQPSLPRIEMIRLKGN